MDECKIVLDKNAIEMRLYQYCQAVDICNYDLLCDVYWPDAVDDHGFYVGNAYEFAAYNTSNTPLAFESTWHSVTNIVIKIDGDVADVESRLIAYHRLRADSEWLEPILGSDYANRHAGLQTSHDYLVGGGYTDRFERRQGVWRIANRRAYTSWQTAAPSALTGLSGLFGAEMGPSPRA